MKRNFDAIGLDIGGTNLRIGRVDRDYSARDIEISSSREIFSNEDSVSRISAIISDYISTYLGNRQPAFVSIGLPAVLNKDRSIIFSATNFPGLKGNFLEKIRKSLAIPVILEHDAYFLLAYDMLEHGVQQTSTCVGIYFGTGLGTAIFLNGIPYTGKNGTAAELGHVSIPFDTRLCSCGNQGCIEMYCCGKALEQIQKSFYKETVIADMFNAHHSSKILRNFIGYMSMPAAAIANILDPDHIFIGGGIPNMIGFPKTELEAAIRKITRKPFPESNLSIIFSDNRAEKGIIGAVIEGNRKLHLQADNEKKVSPPPPFQASVSGKKIAGASSNERMKTSDTRRIAFRSPTASDS